MSQHQWSVDYESCHQLLIRRIVTAQNTIPELYHKDSRFWWLTYRRRNVHHTFCYLTIAQCPKCLLSSSSLITSVSLISSLPTFPVAAQRILSFPQISSCNLSSCRNKHIDSILSQQWRTLDRLLCANDCKSPNAVHSLAAWVIAPLRPGKVEIYGCSCNDKVYVWIDPNMCQQSTIAYRKRWEFGR